MRIMLIALATISAAVAAPAQAQTQLQSEVYRWTDADGVVHYADKPLAPGAKPAILPPLQTFPPGATPQTTGSADTRAPGAGATTIASKMRIIAPAAGSHLRAPQGQLTIEVTAEPAVNQGLVFYVDGTPQNAAPTPSTAFLVSGITPGPHILSAALVDAGRNEIDHARVSVVVTSAGDD